MNSRKFNIFITLLFSVCFAFALVEAKAQIPAKWFFGQNAGVDFLNANGPVGILGSAMSTPAGCALSDNGQLYGNGQTIWIGGGTILNGTGLDGNIQSTQSILFVQPIKSDTLFAFTTDALGGSKGLKYNMIRPWGGGYKVIKKNVPLLSRVSEKLAITLHCNKYEYWVLAHGWNSNKFYAYKIGKDDFDPTPVISSVGSVHGGNGLNAAGYMKISMLGDKLGLAKTGSGLVEVFHFDNIHGQVSDPISIVGLTSPYGVEFDYYGDLLYVSTLSGQIYQYDVSVWDSLQIAQSKVMITTDVSLFGALQIAWDHKIYLARDNATYLAKINFPSQSGLACDFVPSGLYLMGNRSEAGLPPTHLNTQMFDTKGSKNCIGDTSYFKILGDTNRIDSVFWDFGDSLSSADTSTLFSPFYVYPNRYTYTFTLIIYHCEQADTFQNYVQILGPPYANLGPDTALCDNNNFELFGGYATDYLWQDGSTTQTYPVVKSGKYWVRLTNSCGESSDTVNVLDIYNHPNVVLPPDTVLCKPDSILLSSGLGPYYTSIWLDSLIQDSILINHPGLYNLLVIDTNGCKGADDIVVGFDTIPLPNLGEDTVICIGQSITLNGNTPGIYLWNTGSNSHSISVVNTGRYIVKVSNKCGSASDTVDVKVDDCDQVIWVPNAFTPNNDGVNDVFLPYVENVSTYTLSIFNRWGQLVFQTNNPNEGWDGSYKGKPSLMDSYSWKMEFQDFQNQKYTKYGFVILYR